jgi:uncharacterized OsmC-like protein
MILAARRLSARLGGSDGLIPRGAGSMRGDSMDQHQKHVVNGINVDALSDLIQNVKDQPALGRSQFRAHNTWLGAGHNRSQVKDFYAAGQEHSARQSFVVDNDEPPLLLGNDEAPNPVENLLHALAGCLTSTMAYHAAARGIHIDSIEADLEGDIDLQGFMGISEQVPKGYQNIRVTYRVKSDADAAKLEELARFSPVFNTLTNSVPVEVRVIKAS